MSSCVIPDLIGNLLNRSPLEFTLAKAGAGMTQEKGKDDTKGSLSLLLPYSDSHIHIRLTKRLFVNPTIPLDWALAYFMV